jgi:hypothetical protein
MFIITEADAAAIRAVFDQEGELSAAILSEALNRLVTSQNFKQHGICRRA